jgi:uncharacterized sulfatase
MPPPNVLLVTSDQQHHGTIGAFNPQISTPSLDRLVREGSTFSRAYCADPTCTPTRASIITGRFPSQHGAWSLGTKLPESEPTLGAYLQEAGYATALIGKAHFQPLITTPEYPSIEAYPTLHDLDFWREFQGPYYGFEHIELLRNHTSEAHAGQHYALWLEERAGSGWRDHFQPPTGSWDPDRQHRWTLPEALHYNAWIAERTTAFIDRSAGAGRPFFAWASFPDPHPPYLVPEPWDTMYDPAMLHVPELVPGEHDRNARHFGLTQEHAPDFSEWAESGQPIQGFASHLRDPEERRRLVATYYAMISFTDHHIGRILEHVDAIGIENETIVIFTTDHGHFFGQHGLQAKGPFLYEDLIRVPFIVRRPGRIPAGRVSSAIQSHVDIAPTVLALADMPIPRTMTGVNQLAVWEATADRARDHAVVEFHHEPTTLNLRTYVDDRFKLTVYQGRTDGELFDLLTDPDEHSNLWSAPESAALKSELLLRLAWAELAKEPMWMPRVARA